MIPAIPVKALTLGAALGVALFSGSVIRGWKCEADQKAAVEAALRARVAQEELARKHSEELETALAALRQQNRTLARKLSHETRDAAYRCPVPFGGVQLLDDARTGAPAAGEPDR